MAGQDTGNKLLKISPYRANPLAHQNIQILGKICKLSAMASKSHSNPPPAHLGKKKCDFSSPPQQILPNATGEKNRGLV